MLNSIKTWVKDKKEIPFENLLPEITGNEGNNTVSVSGQQNSVADIVETGLASKVVS